MATHDYNLANQSGASFRSDLNNALAAVLSNNSGASSPSTTVAYMLWADTNTSKLKIRNSSNDAWVDLINLDGTIARDLTLTGSSANIIFDQSDNALEFNDNAKATFGTDADLIITHDGSNSIINENGTGVIKFQIGGTDHIVFDGNGFVLTSATATMSRIEIKGNEGGNANLDLTCDEGDDNGDSWRLQSVASTNELKFLNDLNGSLVAKATLDTAGKLTLTGPILVAGGTSANPALSFAGNPDAGLFSPSDNIIQLCIDGTNQYTFGISAFIAAVDNARNLGQGTKRWDNIFATNATINTSDRNEKNTITATDLGLDFVNKLTPVSYKFNNRTRTHYGLIAQDVETLLGTISKSATDFAGYCKDTITEDADGNTLDTPFDRYGLRYTEFIAPMIKAIQELSAKVTALEGS
jgi:hypothetical protein|tara:strand:- start:1029 stop:2264 length:1236 start_codon:yes stop_codon:yes gene_type:complete